MSASQNGWPLSPARSSRKVRGSDVSLVVADGPAGDILIYVAEQFNARVEKLVGHDNGGYNLRKIANTNTWSNHASATAIDLEWDEHPFGASGTFSADQVREIRKILEACEGTVRWGGDYRTKDEMHFEIVGSAAQCKSTAGRLLGSDAMPTPTPKPSPTPAPPSPKPTVGPGAKGDDVKLVQRYLNVVPVTDPGYGNYGPRTTALVRAYQRAQGLDPDGVVGPRTWQRILAGVGRSAGGGGVAPGSSRPTLRSGDKGEHVAAFQAYANRVFPSYSRIEVDGAFGEGTEAVVREFQRRSGITADGVIGPETWKRLGFK